MSMWYGLRLKENINLRLYGPGGYSCKYPNLGCSGGNSEARSKGKSYIKITGRQTSNGNRTSKKNTDMARKIDGGMKRKLASELSQCPNILISMTPRTSKLHAS